MLRAYHFPFEDLRSDEDMTAGNSLPWRVGEIRAYTPITMDAGDGQTITQIGYRSSPTLWDALFDAIRAYFHQGRCRIGTRSGQ